MNCYNHNEQAALGICKHCNKGICMECLQDTGDGLACKKTCITEVKMVTEMINHNKKVITTTSGNWTSSGVVYLLLGFIFVLSSLVYLKRIDPFLIITGSIFFFYGLYILIKGRIFKKDNTNF